MVSNNDYTDADLGARLRHVREHAQVSQTDAARALGLTPAAISQYESGKRRVDALTLERLARLYAVPLSSLFRKPDAAVAAAPEWEEALRLRLPELSLAGKQGIGQLIQALHDFAELYRRTGTAVPRPRPQPFPPLPRRAFTKREIAGFADQARRFYAIGRAPLPELREFLEAEGFTIFAIPLGTDVDDLAGLFLRHPTIGPIIVVNRDQPHRRRPLILAHELAHGLFHDDRPPILCPSRRSATDDDPTERFADRFAAAFLVPSDALAAWLAARHLDTVTTPEAVVQVARYFGISESAMLRRLKEERRLSLTAPAFAAAQPDVVARFLGYPPLPDEGDQRPPLPPAERLPRGFLTLAYRAVQDERLSLRRVAAMLGISDIELEECLQPDLAGGAAMTPSAEVYVS